MHQQFRLGMYGHTGQIRPDLVPSPLCVWHLAQVFVNTTLPATASPVLLRQRHQFREHFLAIGVGQRTTALEHLLRPRRAERCQDARPALASDRASRSVSCNCPCSTASSSAIVQSGRLEQHAHRGWHGAAGSALPSAGPAPAPLRGDSADTDSVDQPDGQIGRRAGVTSRQQLARPLADPNGGIPPAAWPPPRVAVARLLLVLA